MKEIWCILRNASWVYSSESENGNGHVLKENQRELADSYGSALELALAEQEKSG